MSKDKVVTLRSKGNRKDISKEPEMIELKRMIRDGELDKDRVVDYLNQEQNDDSDHEARKGPKPTNS